MLQYMPPADKVEQAAVMQMEQAGQQKNIPEVVYRPVCWGDINLFLREPFE